MQEILNMFKKNSSDKKFDHIKDFTCISRSYEVVVLWRG